MKGREKRSRKKRKRAVNCSMQKACYVNESEEEPVEGLVRLCLLNTHTYATASEYLHDTVSPSTGMTASNLQQSSDTGITPILEMWKQSLGQLNHLSRITVDTWKAWSCSSLTPIRHTAFRKCKPAFLSTPWTSPHLQASQAEHQWAFPMKNNAEESEHMERTGRWTEVSKDTAQCPLSTKCLISVSYLKKKNPVCSLLH